MFRIISVKEPLIFLIFYFGNENSKNIKIEKTEPPNFFNFEILDIECLKFQKSKQGAPDFCNFDFGNYIYIYFFEF